MRKENLYHKRFTHRYIKFHPGQDSRCYPDYSQRWRGRQLREYVFLELAFRCWPRAIFHRSVWISKCLLSWPGHHRGRTHSEYARLLARPRWNRVHDRRCTELNHLPRVFWTGRWEKRVSGKRKFVTLFLYLNVFNLRLIIINLTCRWNKNKFINFISILVLYKLSINYLSLIGLLNCCLQEKSCRQ